MKKLRSIYLSIKVKNIFSVHLVARKCLMKTLKNILIQNKLISKIEKSKIAMDTNNNDKLESAVEKVESKVERVFRSVIVII